MQDITSWGQLILAVAIAVLTIVVIPILPQLKALVVALITAKVNEVQSKYGNDTSAHYVKILNDTIYDVVNGLSQSTVDGLKSLTENGGKLPPGKADELKNQALGEVLSAISDEGIKALQQTYKDLNAIILSKIDSTVRDTKRLGISAGTLEDG